MSPIGRVFIATNFALSGVFLGYSAFYLQQADSWKIKHEKDTAALNQEVQDLQSRNQALQDSLKTANMDVRSLKGRLDERKTQLTAAEEENSTLRKKLDEVSASLSTIEGKFNSMDNTLENLSRRNQELTNNWLAAKGEKDKAIGDRDNMQQDLTSTQARLATAQEAIASLREELTAKSEKVRNLETMITIAKTKVPDLNKILSNTLPKVTGTVMAVNPDLGTVTLSVGKDQAEVSKGWTFAIYDGSNYKADVQVIDVADNVAYARILNSRAIIKKGDKATTRLD